jgi:DNA-binding XRE family transcriptional regulator
MKPPENWILTEEDKEKLISALTPELALLRTKAEVSQDELAMMIGVSRQTYGAIERQARRMTWNTFLSLIMFYDYNQKTHQLIRDIGAFPYEIIQHFNGNINDIDVKDSLQLEDEMKAVFECLDEQALHSIRTVIMVEYARCNNMPGDAVVKAFDGKTFNPSRRGNIQATMALKAIKEQRNKK